MDDPPGWTELFERARSCSTSLEAIQTTRQTVQTSGDAGSGGEDPTAEADAAATDEPGTAGSSPEAVSEPSEPDPARVVADADVLAADLLVGRAARDALDHVRRHDWVELVASDQLLDVAQAVVATLADDDTPDEAGETGLAEDWRARIERERTAVVQPPADNPALASAYRGGAGHLLSFDGTLTSASANRSLRPYTDLSIRAPDAFARLFDPESLYEHLHDQTYPGPDSRR